MTLGGASLTKFSLGAVTLLVLGCATAGESTPDSPRDTLTRVELLETSETILYDAIQRLRPRWLRARSGGFESRATTQVFLDGSPRGDVAVLREIQVLNVDDVSFLSATDAATLYGTVAGIGAAILVRTR